VIRARKVGISCQNRLSLIPVKEKNLDEKKMVALNALGFLWEAPRKRKKKAVSSETNEVDETNE
jgi:hypothetical protein